MSVEDQHSNLPGAMGAAIGFVDGLKSLVLLLRQRLCNARIPEISVQAP